MPTFRIAKEGFFLGKYQKAGDELVLNEKQAKYPLLSGQIERTAKETTRTKMELPRAVRTAPVRVGGERVTRRGVGGSMSGSISTKG